MSKFIKTALVFMGGMTAGGFCVVNVALKSKTIATALEDAIAKKTIEILYERKNPTRQKVSYYSIYGGSNRRNMANRCLECCEDLVFKTRQDAEMALTAMTGIVEEYGYVSLADLYDIAGVDSPSYAANKYGWTSVINGKVLRGREGYFIKLPKAIEIK